MHKIQQRQYTYFVCYSFLLLFKHPDDTFFQSSAKSENMTVKASSARPNRSSSVDLSDLPNILSSSILPVIHKSTNNVNCRQYERRDTKAV